MTSPRQIEANRRNAEMSTGPITLEGKQRSRCNAVRHGLTAETVIAGVEDQEDYQAFEAAVIADYDVESAVERELVLRLASVLWRLRRATGIEAALFEEATRGSGNVHPKSSESTSPSKSEHPQPFLGRARAASGSNALDPKANIGTRFLGLMSLPTFPLDRLSRYESFLWRQARQNALTLELLRRRVQRTTGPRSRFPFGTRWER